MIEIKFKTIPNIANYNTNKKSCTPCPFQDKRNIQKIYVYDNNCIKCNFYINKYKHKNSILCSRMDKPNKKLFLIEKVELEKDNT